MIISRIKRQDFSPTIEALLLFETNFPHVWVCNGNNVPFLRLIFFHLLFSECSFHLQSSKPLSNIMTHFFVGLWLSTVSVQVFSSLLSVKGFTFLELSKDANSNSYRSIFVNPFFKDYQGTTKRVLKWSF